jgi:DNA-binding transcriptional LysR family regulator
MNVDLAGLNVFLAIAETRNFRAAADRLGVTRPAVSQSLRRLEDSLGIALFQRTTRSVRLTEAGERLRDTTLPAFSDIQGALAATRDRDAAPSGRLRLAVSSIAEWFLAGPLLAGFVDAYPDIALDLTVTDEEFDIVAAGYDAGVRLGEIIEQDMIAVPASRDQRQLVVASPAYLDRHGIPAHPRELVDHRCIGWRPSPDVAPYRWDFEENGRGFDVGLSPQVATNDMRVMVNVALAGGGLTFGMRETFSRHIDQGELVAVLENFCPRFPGFFLYYPDRRNHAPKLRAFVDHVRRQASEQPAASRPA